MIGSANAKGRERCEIGFLNAIGRRLDQHLILEVMLRPIGVIAITTIGGAPARFWIGHRPGLRSNRPKHRMRAHGSSTLFRVVGLQQHTTLLSPKAIQRADDVLEMHTEQGPDGGDWTCSRSSALSQALDRTSNDCETGQQRRELVEVKG